MDSILCNNYNSLRIGLQQLLQALMLLTILNSRKASALVLPGQASAGKVQPYRLHLGQECEVSGDCTGGICSLDNATGSGKHYCVCLQDTFRYVIAAGLEICLKCRDLNSLCSFDQECQCTDKNAICKVQESSGKSRCNCQGTYVPVPELRGRPEDGVNLICKPGGVGMTCLSDDECSPIKFVSSSGMPLNVEAKCKAIESVPITAPGTTANLNMTQLADDKPSEGHDLPAVASPNLIDVMSIPKDDTVSLPTADLGEDQLSTESSIARNLANLTSATNTPETANTTCQCPPGFINPKNDSFICQDVDECRVLQNPCNPLLLENSDVICVNTVGGFVCECNSTFAITQGLPQSGICCREGHIPCMDSSRCIPLEKLCNGFPDCELDCSDELYPFCNFNKHRIFPELTQFPQCHDDLAELKQQSIGSAETSTAQLDILPVSMEDSGSGFALLPLGAQLPAKQLEIPPNPLPTLPANMTSARLLGYVLA